jgi:hypothetical protein
MQGSAVDRSSKAAALPEEEKLHHDVLGGQEARGGIGDGKGPLNPEESVPKSKASLTWVARSIFCKEKL